MPSINRIDQAVLLLKDRLERLQGRAAGASTRASAVSPTMQSDPLVTLRRLVKQGKMQQDDLRKALVRALLCDAMGEELAGSLEFQEITERVANLLQDSEAGRRLMAGALAELGY